ncbi:ClpXP protease specificity-enhancing factor [Thermomonas paludicola]|uniref:ClpXP protease specificity-enhancing factor n=1 Tax=Thermomonas paludicola TaxID=2884874 RepID=UPI0021153CBC|nr:ClpXP protease specificity-enhancing factor [Thermomonas paludicola]
MSERAPPPMTSQRPYLLRAIYEWIADNGLTPHVLVDARVAGVRVPAHTVKDGQVVLNIAERAVVRLAMDNDALRFSARFGGVSQNVVVPMAAVIAIYARESGQGMALPEDPHPVPPDSPAEAALEVSLADVHDESDAPPDPSPEPPRRGGHLRIVK